MATSKLKITTKKDFDATMVRIDALMKRGEGKLTNKEAHDLKVMATAIRDYEKRIYIISAPKTIEGMIELKMYERKLKQKDLAKVMGLGEAKISQILNGKRPPDVAFLKAAHQKLGIDAEFLLTHA